MPKMSGIYAQSDLPIQRYQGLAKKLYSPLLLGDNSALLFYPMNGTDYDVINMWEREQDRAHVLGNQRSRFEFAFLTLANPNTLGENLWIEQLQHALKLDMYERMSFIQFSDELKAFVQEGKEPVFFVNIPDSFSDDQLRAFFDLATQIHFIARHRIHFLLTMDMRWNSADFLNLTKQYNTLFEHIDTVPAATNEEVHHFVRHFFDEWKYPLSQSVENLLVEEAGGSLVLPKYALRLIIKERLTKLDDIRHILHTHPDYLRLVRMFLSRITPLQKDILSAVANNAPIPDQEEAQNLAKLGMIRRFGASYETRSLSLARYLRSKQATQDVRFLISSADFLSKREKLVLLGLFDASGKPVSREQIGIMLWGSGVDQKYSEWSVDKVMSRLRKKVDTHIIFQPYSLITHKKKGFSFSP